MLNFHVRRASSARCTIVPAEPGLAVRRSMSEHPKTEESAAVWVQLDELKPWKENPRHNQLAVQKVAASITRFGFGAPLLARTADKQIIAGHTRFLAAKALGLRVVPVRFLDLDPV